jgi:ATP adenylyltransferase/5',5'''-P-1,P-4-tetraphosphate phosphorylase II
MTDLQDIISKTGQTAEQVLTQFAEAQKQSWPLAAANYAGLAKVEEKQFDFGGFVIKVQFNPERIRSSAAKVDKQSIAERKCFLCEENRPSVQNVIGCGERFVILLNPFPIFHRHFTVSSLAHTNQLFFENIAEMLQIANNMEGFTLFYNGPECGASAPDHLHFQAGENDFMPVEAEFELLKTDKYNLLFETDSTKIRAFENYLRRMISIETTGFEEGVQAIQFFTEKFNRFQPEKTEPMLNVLCSYNNGKWVVHLFPRKLHRPSQFFAEGEAQLLISPASVDFGGVFITPRKEDFDKITAADIADIFEQVSIDDVVFSELKNELKNRLRINKTACL